MSFSAIAEEEEVDVCLSENKEIGALDKTYHYLNTKFCQPAIWFDSFFVDERITQDARAGTMVRWYNDYVWTKSEGYHFKTYLKAKVHLPRATKRLKLIFESDADDSVLDLFPTEDEDLESSLGVRYDWYAKERSSFNIKVTARPSIEARYRYSYSLSEDTLFRVTQRVYQRKSVTGEKTQLDLDHTLSSNFLVRWSNFATYDNDLDGFEFGTGVTLYQSISEKQALNYRVSTVGYDKPSTYISNTRLSITYRQNIYRDWLYYEITPEYNWEKEYREEREGETSVTLRLEFLFNNV